MNRNKVTIYVASLLACAMLLPQPPVHAQNAESEAVVEFVPGTGPTYPVHPEDPSTDANGSGVEGSLVIVSVSRFDFGTIPISSKTELISAVTDMPNIQVVDLRGTAVGWKVSASVSRFSDVGGNSLPGAAVRIVDGRPNSLSVSPAPTQIPNTLLTTDGAIIPVVSAAGGAGTGLWVMRWYAENDGGTFVKLEVPAGTATKGNHTATINWILAIAP